LIVIHLTLLQNFPRAKQDWDCWYHIFLSCFQSLSAVVLLKRHWKDFCYITIDFCFISTFASYQLFATACFISFQNYFMCNAHSLVLSQSLASQKRITISLLWLANALAIWRQAKREVLPPHFCYWNAFSCTLE
jgi:hypothetical protein